MPAALEEQGSGWLLGFTRPRAVFFLLFAAFVVVSPTFVYQVFLMKVYCFVIFACAYNLLLGYTGLMSFGHAAFFGMGAYLCGHAATQWGLPIELAVLAGTVFAGLLGFLFGWIAIRRTGLYFAMITLALAQMVFFIAMQAPFTGGENGIQSVPRGTLLGLVDLSSNTNLYVVLAVIVLATLALYNRIVHSPFGQVLRAIRNNPERAKSLGYDVDRFKIVSFDLRGDVGLRRVAEDGRLRHRDADRRVDSGVDRSGPDQPRRRHRHDLRAGGRQLRHPVARALPVTVRAVGAADPGHRIHAVRARLPPGHRRRIAEAAKGASIGSGGAARACPGPSVHIARRLDRSPRRFAAGLPGSRGRARPRYTPRRRTVQAFPRHVERAAANRLQGRCFRDFGKA